MIVIVGLRRIFPLPIEFLLNEAIEVVFGDVLELVAAGLSHEPLKYLLEGVLPTLLIGYIVAVC